MKPLGWSMTWSPKMSKSGADVRCASSSAMIELLMTLRCQSTCKVVMMKTFRDLQAALSYSSIENNTLKTALPR
jgi:hypothetical protein